MTKQIVRQAPYLRRYARALTGSQASGDRLVEGAIESLLTGATELPSELPLRVGLYRALHQVWSGEGANAGGTDSVADQRLQGLSPSARSVLLLTAMESFTPAEAAQVLDLPLAELLRRSAEAEARLAESIATDVLIVEDEPIIALDLTRLVRDLGHRVVGTAATRDEAVALAGRTEPGLVLCDIRLADGSSGLDAAADILAAFDIPVIFITAFPEHLLTGERPEPAFLVTKPFREDAVKAIIGQALFFRAPEARRRIA